MLEIERKYLVEVPSSWSDLSKMFESMIDVKRITQCYLKAKDGEQAARIRKTVEGLTGKTKTIYHYNIKKYVSKISRDEKETEIDKDKFDLLMMKKDPDLDVIEKTRFVFKYSNHTFELDLFKKQLSGLAILEVELKSEDDEVSLPHFLKMKKEVTEDKKYSNYELSKKNV